MLVIKLVKVVCYFLLIAAKVVFKKRCFINLIFKCSPSIINQLSIKPTAIPLLVLGGNSKNKDDRLILCELRPMFDEAFSFDRDQEV